MQEKAEFTLTRSDCSHVEWQPDIPHDYKFDEYPTVSERYYTKKYYRPALKNENTTESAKSADPFITTCILLHSNGCCIVCVSPQHPIVTDETLAIDEIDFQTGPKTNRLESKPVGKSKKMAQQIKHEDELICRITTTDGKVFKMAAGVRGRLIEINDQISTNPNLIKSRPTTDGYIAVVMPSRNGYSFTPSHSNDDTFQDDEVKGQE